MADAPKQTVRNPLEAVAILAVIAILLRAVYIVIEHVLNTFGKNDLDVISAFKGMFPLFDIISIIVSLLAIIGIIILQRKISAIRAEEQAAFERQQRTPTMDGVASTLPGAQSEKPAQKNPRWQEVVEYAESENQNDWRHAIIEADILLDELLTAIGMDGDTVGEKLKRARGLRFDTLDRAWEAHKVRNALAHEGSKYRMSHREVRRIVDLYRQVFEEFHFV